MTATNFEQFVIPLAEEAPHAVVLDWYRRLELAIRDYLTSRRIRYRTGPAAEDLFLRDPFLGPGVAASVGELRLFRNRIAHEPQSLTPIEAVTFARESLSLIGCFWKAQDEQPSLNPGHSV